MKDQKIYMYHNENTGVAIWASERFYNKSTTAEEFEIMAGIHETVREVDSDGIADLLHGVRIMLTTSGNRIT
jgi:hypothetical protein